MKGFKFGVSGFPAWRQNQIAKMGHGDIQFDCKMARVGA
jgi:hypothetical protein